MNTFRVLDLIVQEKEKESTIYISYHYFNPLKKEKKTQLASVVIDNNKQLESQKNLKFTPTFVAKPSIPYDVSSSNAPFRSNRNAGRLALLNDETLLLVLGDNQYDGVVNSRRDPENGKGIKINLNSLESEHWVKVLCNPQGLVVTKSGDVFETEFGPQGGYELNKLIEGNDYGLPSVTYGVNYGKTN